MDDPDYLLFKRIVLKNRHQALEMLEQHFLREFLFPLKQEAELRAWRVTRELKERKGSIPSL